MVIECLKPLRQNASFDLWKVIPQVSSMELKNRCPIADFFFNCPMSVTVLRGSRDRHCEILMKR